MNINPINSISEFDFFTSFFASKFSVYSIFICSSNKYLATSCTKLPCSNTDSLFKSIFSCGLYHSKAEHILQATTDIINLHGGEIPNDYEKLLKLSGVGRKTANVVWAVAFNQPAIAVDTHVFRVANRIGFAKANNPLQTEKQLMQILPKDKWRDCHHYIIFYGRQVCTAKNPKCDSCEISEYCDYFNSNIKK